MRMATGWLAAMLMAAAGCATTPVEPEVPDIRDTDPMIVQVSTTAREAYAAGETPRAVVLYRRALARAQAMDNSREVGRISYNLAVCLVSLEEWTEAEALLADAERATIKAGDDASPVLLMAAELARRRDQLSEAEAAIDRLERLPVSDEVRGQAYVMRAHIACDRGDAARAEGFLSRAMGFLKKNRDPGLAGSMAEVTARVAILKGDHAGAGKAYDLQASWLLRAERLPEMAEALEAAGRQYETAGEADAAADRYYRAARSLMGQERYLDALRVIELAVKLKETAADPADASDIARLFDEIRRSLEKTARAATGPSAK